MKKKFKGFLIVAGTLVVIYSVLSATAIFKRYKVTTISGYPNLKRGDHFFVSSLKKPKRFDLVCFYADIPYEGHTLVAQRLCGVAGDTVELKNGILFINGENADKNLNLSDFTWYL